MELSINISLEELLALQAEAEKQRATIPQYVRFVLLGDQPRTSLAELELIRVVLARLSDLYALLEASGQLTPERQERFNSIFSQLERMSKAARKLIETREESR